MQMKHLIIFALAGIVVLIGFNIFNGNRHEQNRAVAVNSDTPSETVVQAVNNDASTDSSDIASKPLGQQPKAILDKASTDIEQAEQLNQERLEQMSNTQ